MVMKDICPFTKKEFNIIMLMYAFHNRQSRLLCTCNQEAGVLFQIQFWPLILSCCCCCRGINLVGAAIIGVWEGEQGGRGTLRAYVYKQISSQSLLLYRRLFPLNVWSLFEFHGLQVPKQESQLTIKANAKDYFIVFNNLTLFAATPLLPLLTIRGKINSSVQ